MVPRILFLFLLTLYISQVGLTQIPYWQAPPYDTNHSNLIYHIELEDGSH